MPQGCKDGGLYMPAVRLPYLRSAPVRFVTSDVTGASGWIVVVLFGCVVETDAPGAAPTAVAAALPAAATTVAAVPAVLFSAPVVEPSEPVSVPAGLALPSAPVTEFTTPLSAPVGLLPPSVPTT